MGESNNARAKLMPTKFGSPNYTHEVDLVAFTGEADDYATVENLAKDTTVSVVRDNNGNIMVYGLEVTKADTDTANTDTGGSPKIILASTREKGLADFFAAILLLALAYVAKASIDTLTHQAGNNVFEKWGLWFDARTSWKNKYTVGS
ncbi:MAG: hypothetical protein EOO63_04220 [Hymenobacter sp.]|nr:MAG: hypothetical protein EOO63_04220 [Hymenobacter sp.]